MPQIRDSDRVPLDDSTPVTVKFSRVIPTWQIVSTISALLIAAIGNGIVVYYGLQDQIKETRQIKEEQRELKTQMREMNQRLDDGRLRSAEIGYELLSIKQRIAVLEAKSGK